METIMQRSLQGWAGHCWANSVLQGLESALGTSSFGHLDRICINL